MYLSNYTDKELIQFFDSHPCKTDYEAVLLTRLESALEREELLPGRDELTSAVQEAIAQYPNEDFLEELIYEVQELRDVSSKAGKMNLKELVKSLQDKQDELFHAAEYGIEQLSELIKG